MNALNVNRKLAVAEEVQSVPCEKCGWPSLSYQCFTECRDSWGRTKNPVPFSSQPSLWCWHTWRLPGEKREVQCHRPANHGGPHISATNAVSPA